MECLVAIGNSIVGKIAEYTVEPIGRQFGYLFYYESNIDNIKTQFQHLKDTKQDLEHFLEERRRRGEEITECGKTWLSKADNISEMVQSFQRDEGQANTGCSTKSFPNLVLRHRLSRRAKKMAQSVVGIKEEAPPFDKVCYVPILQNILETEGYTVFETRNSILKEIMEALGNNAFRKIGVYGMAGVGKTTLAKEVAKRALQANSFSDAVVVSVSESPKLEKIQQDIADRLGLVFDEDGVNARAVRLRHRLKTEKNLLIVLDDVWKKLDLLDIGVCFEDEQKGCKILLTSRSLGVLEDDMGVKKNFKVELLSESEAWTWFSKIVGDNYLLSDENSEFKHFATEIVKECARLPLAIITVAHSLKNKGIHYWKDALSRLQRSSMDEKVYLSVKLSYDYLADREERSVLLFCSLREEDEEMSFDDLLNWCIGWDLFKDIYTLEEARNRLQRLLDELKSRCLLLKGNYRRDSVKMHDVIRDVGISIASKDSKMYNIRSNDELKKYLDNININELKDSIAISLGANYEDECLPSRLNCPELLLLSMGREGSSLPDNFFEETKKLRVLNLSSLRLKPMPSSFCCLENLQALHLVAVEIGEIHLIGELKKLKVLDLRRSEMEQLPEQIGQLTCLRKLDLCGCRIEVVPPNVISRLVNLEELNMKNSFSNWKAEGVVDDENRSSASLREVKNLTKLTALYLEIPHANMLPKHLFSTKLERYYIELGGGLLFFRDVPTALELNLEFDTSSLLKERGFQMLLKRSENLLIQKFNGLKSIVSELNQEGGFKHLKALVVVHNDEIQYMIDYSSMEPNHTSDHGVLPSLETFQFLNVENLEKICRGELRGTKPLGKLRKAEVSGCNKLKNLLPFSIANKLEEIEVSWCSMMEEIVTSEAVDRIEFLNLKNMELRNLPQLTRFCSECDTSSGTPDQGQESEQQLYHSDSSSTLFNQKVALPRLEFLDLYELNIKRIWADQLPQTSYGLQNLRTLKVGWCNSLKYLLSFAIARSLAQLEELVVSKCEGMEVIIVLIKEPTVTFDNSDELHIIEFPKLKRMELQNLPQLIQFCSQSQGQGSEQLLFADSASTFFNQKVALPAAGLEFLDLNELNIKRIWADQLPQTSYGLQNLRTLKVVMCNSLKYLLSFAIARSLAQLEELVVSNCEGMEVIIVLIKEPTVTFDNSDELHIIEFPKLKRMELRNLPQLIQFCSQSQGQGSEQLLFADSASTFFNQKVAFPSLESLELHELNSNKRIWPNQLPETSKLHNLRELFVSNCKRLKYVLPFAIAESLVQLKELTVGECEEVEEIIMITEPKEVEKIDKKLLPKLQKVDLFNLPNFARFCSIDQTNNICGLNFVPEVCITNCSKLWSRSAEKDKNSMQSPCDEKQVEFSAGLDKSSLNSVQRIPYDPLLPNFTTKLELYNCDNVENLLSASMAKSFVHLRTLDVTNFKLLKEVVVTEESGDGIRFQKNCFPALKHLVLCCLPNLEKFCAGDHIECLFLEMLQIESCPKLSTFISDSIDEAVSEETDMDSVATQPALFNNQKVKLPKLRILKLEKCNSVIEIWHDTKDKGQQSAAAGRSSSAFQSLECLLVFDCGSLNKLEANSSVIFESLTVVDVLKCDRLEYLFTPSAAKTLVLLKKMRVSKCQAMKEIIASSSSEANHDDKLLIASFRNLELLVLDSLHSLTSFHMGSCALEFPKLRCVAVAGSCPELRSFCGHGTITTPKLRTFVRTETQIDADFQTWFDYTDSQIIIHDEWFRSLAADNTGDKIELQEEEGGNIDINTTIQQFWENYHAQK